MITKRLTCVALNAALCASAATLVGCSQQPPSTTAPPAAASTAPASSGPIGQAQPYTPPTAEQLYQLVAPIALFPDKLVAQVLAAATYPDQVTSADRYLAQNTNLQGSSLQDQVAQQSWDPSIKGLTAFPKVLDQMAQNIPWTASLGEAYVNDPTDVLNAIQVMRQRATQQGSLRNSAQLHVVEQPVAQPNSSTEPTDGYPPAYAGPDVVPAPQQEIEILPAQPDTVYVPEYDPETVYGEELPSYPGYRYTPQGYSTGELVTDGAIGFGVGIVVASLFEHSHQRERPSYGWNSWGMNWRDHHEGNGGNAGWQRPTVVHNSITYVSNSTTIVNRYAVNNRVSSGSRTHAMPATAPSTHRATSMELARPSAAAARKPTGAPDFHGTLTPGEPARFARPATASPVSPRPQSVAHMAPQPASKVLTARRLATGTAASMHPVRTIAPAATARPRLLPKPASISRAVPPSNQRVAPTRLPAERPAVMPSRPIRPVEPTAPTPHFAAPRKQPSRPQPEIERRATRRAETATAVRESPRMQTAPHKATRLPITEPRKVVPKDAKKRDKQGGNGH